MSQQKVLFNPTTLRNLGDKSYEKRKTAAVEIESVARQLSTQPGSGQYINAIISTLVTEYTFSTLPNSRKGGLIALSSIAIALLHHASPYLELLLPPVLRCFVDQDARVRYYACESLYNIIKICRTDILLYFNELFDGLCKLSADQDSDVRAGCMLLDRLLKDVVSSADSFNIGHFIPLLRERIRLKHPHVRLLILNWISMLNSLYDVAMLEFLPDLLSGLFAMLSDPHKDVKVQTMNILHTYLQQITTSPKLVFTNTLNIFNTAAQNQSIQQQPQILHNIEYSTMIFPIVQHATTNDATTRSVIVVWLHNFILLSKENILPFLPHIIGALFCCIHDDSVENGEVRTNALHTNDLLLQIVRHAKSGKDLNGNNNNNNNNNSKDINKSNVFPILAGAQSDNGNNNNSSMSATSVARQNREVSIDYPTLISHFITQLPSNLLSARIVSIMWLSLLLVKYPHDLTSYVDTILPPLLLLLQTETDAQVFMLIIECLARIILLPSPQSNNTTTNNNNTKGLMNVNSNNNNNNDEDSSSSNNNNGPGNKINLHYFMLICVNLLSLFANDIKFLELRAQRILCTLSTFIPGHYVMTVICSLLRENKDIQFTKIMVETLYIILFTTEEFHSVRQILMESSLLFTPNNTNNNNTSSSYDKTKMEKKTKFLSIFLTLFSAFVHSPIPLISLCILSGNYILSSGVMTYLLGSSTFQPSIGLLLQLEQFVQLFESSIFSHCRCNLLLNDTTTSSTTTVVSNANASVGMSNNSIENSNQNLVIIGMNKNALLHTLYSLLSLLPQSHCFFMLKNRLEVSTTLVNSSGMKNGVIIANSSNGNNNTNDNTQLIPITPNSNTTTTTTTTNHQNVDTAVQQFALSQVVDVNKIQEIMVTTQTLDADAILQLFKQQQQFDATITTDIYITLLRFAINAQKQHDGIKTRRQRASLLVSDEL